MLAIYVHAIMYLVDGSLDAVIAPVASVVLGVQLYRWLPFVVSRACTAAI